MTFVPYERTENDEKGPGVISGRSDPDKVSSVEVGSEVSPTIGLFILIVGESQSLAASSAVDVPVFVSIDMTCCNDDLALVGLGQFHIGLLGFGSVGVVMGC